MLTDPTDFISVSDFSRLTGISRSLVYQLIRNGELPAVRLGARGGLRILRPDLNRFIEARRVNSRAEQGT